MLFIDFSSAFNTIVSSRLAGKLIELGLNTPLSAWILDFLTARPSVVRVGRQTSRPLTLNTGCPQDGVHSPLLYSLYTHDCVASFSSNTIVKFVHDTVVDDLILGNDEKAYLEEVAKLSLWCQDNRLMLNVSKMKEMIKDATTSVVNGTAVERVSSFRYLGVHITDDLTWTTHIDTLVRKVKQCLYHLRQLRKFPEDPSDLLHWCGGEHPYRKHH